MRVLDNRTGPRPMKCLRCQRTPTHISQLNRRDDEPLLCICMDCAYIAFSILQQVSNRSLYAGDLSEVTTYSSLPEQA